MFDDGLYTINLIPMAGNDWKEEGLWQVSVHKYHKKEKQLVITKKNISFKVAQKLLKSLEDKLPNFSK